MHFKTICPGTTVPVNNFFTASFFSASKNIYTKNGSQTVPSPYFFSTSFAFNLHGESLLEMLIEIASVLLKWMNNSYPLAKKAKLLKERID